MAGEFTPEQKRYLEGLVAGLAALHGPASAAPSGPDAAHLRAMARAEAEGKKLSDPEQWKRELHPFDAFARLEDQTAKNEFPKGADNFRWRFYGLFYVAPAQDAYMCRLRIPNGILKAAQLEDLADLALRYGGGYSHVTTRANLQIREIAARDALAVYEGVHDLGLTTRGAGADNIRNVTGDATAGVSPRELLDTRPLARAWHFHVLNDRSLYGLPRKFNVAFDGGGDVATLEETNDVGFRAVRVGEGAPVPPGVYLQLVLGGVTGHLSVAVETDVVLAPEAATQVADAIVRVYIEHGDRTDRKKARLKYLIDAWGMPRFLAAVEAALGRTLARCPPDSFEQRPPRDRLAHIGVHPQRQEGLHYLGVVLPVGKMTAAQMRSLAATARELGDGDLRLTVWQNAILSGIPSARVEEAKARIVAAGLAWKATPVRAGLVACTGITGCKLASANTKDTAEEIVAHVEARLSLDAPLNIHLTGCPNSCAQAYIGDIGLTGCRVPVGADGETAQGFHISVGGGYGEERGLGRELWRDIKVEDCPVAVERLLRAYLAHREGSERFLQFSRRNDVETLRRWAEEVAL